VARPDLAALLPVSNQPESDEARSAPPFAYPTPTLLAEAADFVAASSASIRRALSPSSPVFAATRAALAGLPGSLRLSEVPREAHARGLAVGLDPGAYVHRYGAMDASAREDLAARVPPSARTVLDAGCSRGATGPALRARGVTRIVGIEPDPEAAAAAARVYDRVLACRLEEVVEDFTGRFDAVLLGDVLEHLEDPSGALVRVRPWLSERGRVVASVPNAGHWSIVDDLIRGRFDYVPYSLLSGTHLRLFTRRTLEDLFAASGFLVEAIDTVVLPLSPKGAERLARLRAFPGASADLEVAEFIAVARADG
jgi:2-polyprenyl-3-methyl-5-hydroxy-6-metoxy-1,4-benzoquinol methylase